MSEEIPEEENEQPEQLDPIVDNESTERITHVSGMYENWFLDYASYVILERAVPYVEDGLKPVQRRILHSMKELDDGRYNKVANVIGHTMKYHPHGDASIGDALVQLGQKDILIDCQGNWGNIYTGDSAAAPRYIEARLSKLAGEILFNPKMKPTKDGKSSVKKCHSANNGTERYFVEDDITIISNVITTAAFNHSEYKKYDPNFKHDAPCPMEIYNIMVSSYTMPGDTCIDIHCGSGQGLEVFARNGCNAIGVDIDPVSIEFCEKRMRMVLGQECEVELQMAA